MEEQDLYDKVCQPAFERIETDVKTILTVLKGDGRNGDKPGLCERLRTLENEHKKVRRIAVWAGGILGGTWLAANAITIISWAGKLLTIKPNP